MSVFLACIVRLPKEISSHSRAQSVQANALLDITSHRNHRQQSHIRLSEPSEETEQPAAMATSLVSQPTQWALRRRESSDRSSQPHSAPAGSLAQQSENFQRFFRAVRSPTHVRVTAGGRIVPNTRATSPPGWNDEKGQSESKNTACEIELTNQQPPTWHHNASRLPLLLPSGFMHAPGSFLPQGSLAAMASPQFSNFEGPDQTLIKQNVNDLNGKVTSEYSTERMAPLPQQVRISPPTQFDNTKPFMYNGQLVYPVPPPSNAQALSMTILGNPNFIPQASTGHFAPPSPFAMPMTSTSNPLMFPGQQFPMTLPPLGAENMPGMLPFAPPSMPIPSLSDLTRAQIQTLRARIDFIDNQFSSHQLDPSFVQTQRTMILSQIKSMERMLESQGAAENSAQLNVQRDGNLVTSRLSASSQENEKPPGAGTHQETASHNLQPAFHVPSGPGIDHSRDQEDPEQQNDQVSHRPPSTQSNSMNRSKLSAAAAMAPPFRPRSQGLVVTSPQLEKPVAISVSPSRFSIDEGLPETQAQIEARLFSKASANWGKVANEFTPNFAAPSSLPKSHTVHESSSQVNPAARSMLRSGALHGQASLSTSQHQLPDNPSHTVPYLVGVLPQGLPTKGTDFADLIYPRPLTEEEVRARYLYFGKAPASIQKGLPKFGGKDFYPPSPVKQNARLDPYRTALPEFRPLLTEPSMACYKTKSPIRISSSHPDFFSLPVQKFAPSGNSEMRKSLNSSSWNKHFAYQEQKFRPGNSRESHQPPSAHDFSPLFLEHGIPSYRSLGQELPSGQAQSSSSSTHLEINDLPRITARGEQPTGNDDMCSVGSWGVSRDVAKQTSEASRPPTISGKDGLGGRDDSISDSSSVEINLHSRSNGAQPKAAMDISWQERVANFSK